MCVEKTPWEQVIDFHGHTCPEIAVGYRVAQIAARELGLRPSASAELFATAEIHSCALDALQILNKVPFGRGNLKVNALGNHVYHFQYAGTTEGIRIRIKPEVLERVAAAHIYNNVREKQNKALEAIQYVLSLTEEAFCSTVREPGWLES